MKIVYDHFIAKGGAERVSLLLQRYFKHSVVESAYVDKSIFQDDDIKCYGYDYREALIPTLSLMFFYLFKFKLDTNRDYFLSGVFSPLALMLVPKGGRRIVYFHTFPDFCDVVKQPTFMTKLLQPLLRRLYIWLLKLSLKNADQVYSNSQYVKSKFESLKVASEILYPPIVCKEFEFKKSDDYYLVVSRLEENKRVNLILEAFSLMPEFKLVVIGSGSMYLELFNRFKQCNNITLLGALPPEKLKDYYSRCKAVIAVPESEYFGLVAIEALASGKFVIGAKSGGLIETIKNEDLGVLIEEPVTSQKLLDRVQHFEQLTPSLDNHQIRQAEVKVYDIEFFVQRLKCVKS